MIRYDDLTVGSYEDGGALPLCDAERHEKAIKDNYLQITSAFKPETSFIILEIL